jgi:hypothetical protein
LFVSHAKLIFIGKIIIGKLGLGNKEQILVNIPSSVRPLNAGTN